MIVANKPIQSRIDRTSKAGSLTKMDKPKILCIDDDPDITRAIEMALGNFEVEFCCCYNGQQGIWSSISEKPDLIITDWLMPQGGGDDLITTLKRNQDTADIPIVVLSCLGGDRLQHRLFSMGVDGFVQKPISYGKLLAEIGRHIELPPLDSASTGVE